MDRVEGEHEREYEYSPRVNFELTPQTHANFLDAELDQVRLDLIAVPLADGANSSPRRLAESLIGDSQSLLEGMHHGKLTKGSNRIALNLIRAVELLEQSGRAYDEPIRGLLQVLMQASQQGLTIDGYPLSDTKHVERVKG